MGKLLMDQWNRLEYKKTTELYVEKYNHCVNLLIRHIQAILVHFVFELGI
jgi:hypothetical protein